MLDDVDLYVGFLFCSLIIPFIICCMLFLYSIGLLWIIFCIIADMIEWMWHYDFNKNVIVAGMSEYAIISVSVQLTKLSVSVTGIYTICNMYTF